MPWTRHDQAAAEKMFAWCAEATGISAWYHRARSGAAHSATATLDVTL